MTAEQFTNEYIASVRTGTLDEFRKRLRRVDLLAIDDIHFFANKTATQAEFLHTIDAIDLSGARVALVSDEHPRHIRRFSQSLVSRFLSGMVVTIELALLIVVTGLGAGLALALLRSLAIRPLNWLIIFVVDLFRSLPPLVIIVLMYFGLPYAGPAPSGFVSTWLSLAFVLMAFSEEIFWAGITSIPKGQWEASRSTGLSFGQTLFNVVLPQAFRLTIPPLTNRTISITKGTALGTVVAVTEILGQASSAMSNSYNPSPLMMGAAAYVVLFLPVVVAARWIEAKFAWKR